MPPRYLNRPEALEGDADVSVELPYGMTAAGVVAAINDAYAYLHALNRASIEHGYNRLEDLMQPAGFSGLLSQLFVRSLAREFASRTPGLAVNQYPNGRSDLVPRALYPGDAVLRGQEGLEVKVSRAESGWQGHNPETGWVMIVQVTVDAKTQPVYERTPTTVERVMIARLDENDWAFSGRRPGSRRTPTASINALGRQKLERGLARVKRNVQRSIHRQERVTTSLHPPGAEGGPPIPRGGGAASWYCSPYRRGRRCCGCSGRRGSAAPHGPW